MAQGLEDRAVHVLSVSWQPRLRPDFGRSRCETGASPSSSSRELPSPSSRHPPPQAAERITSISPCHVGEAGSALTPGSPVLPTSMIVVICGTDLLFVPTCSIATWTCDNSRGETMYRFPLKQFHSLPTQKPELMPSTVTLLRHPAALVSDARCPVRSSLAPPVESRHAIRAVHSTTSTRMKARG